MRFILALAAVTLAFAEEKPRPPDTGKAALGKRVFEARCASCHGDDARGSAAFAKRVGAYSPDALDLTSERLLKLSDDQLAQRIRAGHGQMKGFDVKLSPAEMFEVVAYIRLLGHAHAGKQGPRPNEG